MSFDCLILAAGASRRFGDCKLLAQWRGKTLLQHTLESARAVAPETIVVVTGAFSDVIRQYHWASGVELRHCEHWREGMGRSLAFGVSQLPAHRPLLVLLGDQPLVTAEDLRRLRNAWAADPHRIACASFADTLGVPAFFPMAIKSQLSVLTGERGAKSFLTSRHVHAVPMPNAAFDIDTPTDLLHLTKAPLTTGNLS